MSKLLMVLKMQLRQFYGTPFLTNVGSCNQILCSTFDSLPSSLKRTFRHLSESLEGSDLVDSLTEESHLCDMRHEALFYLRVNIHFIRSSS